MGGRIWHRVRHDTDQIGFGFACGNSGDDLWGTFLGGEVAPAPGMRTTEKSACTVFASEVEGLARPG